MAIVENSNARLKVTDHDGDSLIVSIEPSGEVVITCHAAAADDWAACMLNDHERRALIRRLGGRA